VHPLPASLWFERDDRQLEIDFLLTAGGRAVALEAKHTERHNARDAPGVQALRALAAARSVRELAGCRGPIVSRTPVTGSRR
jgi:hypothetical protein